MRSPNRCSLLVLAVLWSAITLTLAGCDADEETVPTEDTSTSDDTAGGDDTALRPDTSADDVVEDTDEVDTAVANDTTSDDTAADEDVEDVDDAGDDVSDAQDVEPEVVEPVGSAGCGNATPALAEGENTFVLDGHDRRYILRLPQDYDAERPWPLVLALHGNGGSADYWDGTSGDRNIRGVLANDAVLVIAEAIEGNWRDYSDEANWDARIELELSYFEEVLTQARTQLCIDESAIFSMGFSGGGSFSGVLACRRTDIRAIAVGGSVIYFDPADCVGSAAAWITIGELELTGGREAYRDFFSARAGCDSTTLPVEPDPCVAYEGCATETPVHYCEHPGDHIWPDFGSQAMWDFFSQFVVASQ